MFGLGFHIASTLICVASRVGFDFLWGSEITHTHGRTLSKEATSGCKQLLQIMSLSFTPTERLVLQYPRFIVIMNIHPISILVLSSPSQPLSKGSLPDGYMQRSNGFRKCSPGLAAWWTPDVMALRLSDFAQAEKIICHVGTLGKQGSLGAKHPSCLCYVWILWQPHPLDTNQRAASSGGSICAPNWQAMWLVRRRETKQFNRGQPRSALIDQL